jgi:hypothetical protein
VYFNNELYVGEGKAVKKETDVHLKLKQRAFKCLIYSGSQRNATLNALVIRLLLSVYWSFWFRIFEQNVLYNG